jgi:hypothetical protein
LPYQLASPVPAGWGEAPNALITKIANRKRDTGNLTGLNLASIQLNLKCRGSIETDRLREPDSGRFVAAPDRRFEN